MLVLACVGLGLVRRHRALAPTERAQLPPGVERVAASSDVRQWLREGYIELVSPVRPPTSADGRVRIAVFVQIPAGATLRLAHASSGISLQLPDGARAERIEARTGGDGDAAPDASWQILDVRGTRFESTGRSFRVLRPSLDAPDQLVGLSWPEPQHAPATTALLENVRAGLFGVRSTAPQRDALATHLARLNDCPSCHTRERAPKSMRSDPNLVARGTDASGSVQVSSIFVNRLPLESYRAGDPNRGDPFLQRSCGDAVVPADTERCAGDQIVFAELQLPRALAAGDRHARAVCRSRRALARFFDAEAAAALHGALQECALAPDDGG